MSDHKGEHCSPHSKNLLALDAVEESDSELSSEFSNTQIDTSIIKSEALTFKALSPSYRKMNITFSLILGFILLSALTLFSTSVLFPFPAEQLPLIYIATGIVVFITICTATYHFFADPLKMYAVREHDMNYQSGLWFKSLVSQPILRIQHIELKRGPIERKYKLATLQVFSAGGASYTFDIPGLEYNSAVQLRQFILDHKDLAKDV